MSGVLNAQPTPKQKGGPLLSDKQFDYVLELIYKLTGIAMTASKRLLVERRIMSRMEALSLPTFEDYAELLKRGDPTEVELFTNAVTTNLTSFFRENHHFDFLQKTFLPEQIKRKNNGDRKIRLWSAGCSTGEEPYSIAMALRESMPDIDAWDVKVLCTDIDSEVLAKCEAGVYTTDRVEGMSEQRVKKWFQQGSGDQDRFVKVKPCLRDLLVFRRLNLMQQWPLSGKFDLIFCRNVMIYFDKPTQQKLVDQFSNHLVPNGYLIVGHSESLVRNTTDFELLGRTVYKKVGG